MLASKIFNYRPIRLLLLLLWQAQLQLDTTQCLADSSVISNRSYQSLITNH